MLKISSILSTDLHLVPFLLAKLLSLFITVVGTSHSLSDDKSEEEI